MPAKRPGLSSVYGFIVLFTLFMAGIGAALTIMNSQASVADARGRAEQILASQRGERLALTLNGTKLTVGNIGLTPSTILYLFQKGATTSSDKRLDSYLQEGSNLTVPVTSGMSDFAVITSLGSVFWVGNSTNTLLQSTNLPVTFDASGLDPSYGTSSILTVDGVTYDYSALPTTFEWARGSVHNYSYAQGFSTGAGSRVGWSGARGLSTTMTGSVTVSQTGSVVSSYSQQYLLTVGGGSGVAYIGSPSGDGWYDSGSTGQFSSSYTWGTAAGSRENLYSYSLDGGSPTVVARSGGGAFTSGGITMSAPHTVVLSPATQYQLTASGGNGVTLGGSQTGDGWFDSGSSGTATTNYAWNITLGQSRLDLVSWSVDGGPEQGVTRAASGTFTTGAVAMSAPHTVNFNSITQYYVTVKDSLPGSGTVGPLTVSYSYRTSPITVSQALSNPGFESGGLGGWTSWTSYNGVVTSPVYDGAYAAALSSDGSYGGIISQDIYLPSGSTVSSVYMSMWYFIPNSDPSDVTARMYPQFCSSAQPSGATRGAWTQLTFSWSGSCSTTAGEPWFIGGDASPGVYSYVDDTTVSYTYTYPVSGTTPSSSNSYSVSGNTVTYSYGVGYSFPGGATSDSWSAAWPSTESYSSNSCGGSVSSGTISGTAGTCILTTTSAGSYSGSIGASQTNDGWYDSGTKGVSVTATSGGPFAFVSWAASSGILVASSSSPSTTITVGNFGNVTASFNVNQ